MNEIPTETNVKLLATANPWCICGNPHMPLTFLARTGWMWTWNGPSWFHQTIAVRTLSGSEGNSLCTSFLSMNIPGYAALMQLHRRRLPTVVVSLDIYRTVISFPFLQFYRQPHAKTMTWRGRECTWDCWIDSTVSSGTSYIFPVVSEKGRLALHS